MRYAIIDTSAILFGLANGKNVLDAIDKKFHSYTPMISRGVIRELESISINKGKKGSNARAALTIIRSASSINVGADDGEVDEWVIRSAKRYYGAIVITNDTELAKRLKSIDVEVYKISIKGELKK